MGLTVLDAGVIIGFLDGNDAHHAKARASLAHALEHDERLVMPASAYAEALVGPSRAGPRAVAIVEALMARLPLEVAPLTQPIATEAALVRSKHRSIKLSDALVIATAAVLDADLLVTTDRRWPTRARLGLRATITKL